MQLMSQSLPWNVPMVKRMFFLTAFCQKFHNKNDLQRDNGEALEQKWLLFVAFFHSNHLSMILLLAFNHYRYVNVPLTILCCQAQWQNRDYIHLTAACYMIMSFWMLHIFRIKNTSRKSAHYNGIKAHIQQSRRSKHGQNNIKTNKKWEKNLCQNQGYFAHCT